MPRIVEEKGKQTKLSNFFSAKSKNDDSEVKIEDPVITIPENRPANPFKLRKSVSLLFNLSNY